MKRFQPFINLDTRHFRCGKAPRRGGQEGQLRRVFSREERAGDRSPGAVTFQKEFGTQFFNNYLGSTDLAKKFNGKVKSSITTDNVTRHLSGVIFLDDGSITAKDPKQINVLASFVWNKNAVHSLVGHPLDAELRRRGAVDRG